MSLSNINPVIHIPSEKIASICPGEYLRMTLEYEKLPKIERGSLYYFFNSDESLTGYGESDEVVKKYKDSNFKEYVQNIIDIVKSKVGIDIELAHTVGDYRLYNIYKTKDEQRRAYNSFEQEGISWFTPVEISDPLKSLDGNLFIVGY